MLIKHVNIPEDLWVGIYQTGSSVICNPPVLDTDIDYIICERRVEFSWDVLDTPSLHKFLTSNGFKQSREDEEEYDMESVGFTCYRKDNINLIVTDDYEWYNKWVLATKVAKALNLRNKADRVVLFKAFLYGEDPPPIDDKQTNWYDSN